MQEVYTYTVIPYYKDTQQEGNKIESGHWKYGKGYTLPFTELFVGSKYYICRMHSESNWLNNMVWIPASSYFIGATTIYLENNDGGMIIVDYRSN